MKAKKFDWIGIFQYYWFQLEEDPSENSHSSPTVGQVSTPSSSVSLTRLQTVQNADCSPKFGRCHSAVEDCCSVGTLQQKLSSLP